MFGWIDCSDETWEYRDENTIAVIGQNLVAKYRVGSYLSWNGRYGYIVSCYYDSNNTRINLFGDSVINEPITSKYFSVSAQPEGMPFVFYFNPIFQGFSTAPDYVATLSMIGGRISFDINMYSPGVGVGNQLIIQMPISTPYDVGMVWANSLAWYNNNGVTRRGQGEACIEAGSADIYVIPFGYHWDEGERAVRFHLEYPMNIPII